MLSDCFCYLIVTSKPSDWVVDGDQQPERTERALLVLACCSITQWHRRCSSWSCGKGPPTVVGRKLPTQAIIRTLRRWCMCLHTLHLCFARLKKNLNSIERRLMTQLLVNTPPRPGDDVRYCGRRRRTRRSCRYSRPILAIFELSTKARNMNEVMFQQEKVRTNRHNRSMKVVEEKKTNWKPSISLFYVFATNGGERTKPAWSR